MKNTKFKVLRIVAVSLVCMLLMTLSVSATGSSVSNGDVPYDTFVYYDKSITSDAVQVRGMYDFERIIDSSDLGVGAFVSLTDVVVDSADNVYILDGGAGKIYVLDSDYNYVRTIDKIVAPDKEHTFSNANGFCISSDNRIFIADTAGHRVLISDINGNYDSEMFLPESSLIPESFEYKPIKVAVDSSGYVYVLSDGSYYGAILYSPDGEFLGFYGANTVATSITQVIQKIWYKIIMTDERQQYMQSKLPFQFTDLYVDKQDFIYTATGATTGMSIDKGQIKRMSPGGNNILESNEVTFGLKDAIQKRNGWIYPDVSGVAVNDDGFIFTYDMSSGIVMVYDNECRMLNAFSGGSARDGNQIGNFQLIRAIEVNSKSDILILDSGTNRLSLTVFKLNDYGKLLMDADVLTIAGDYSAALPMWEEILKQDRNCQLGYSGIAKAYLQRGDYSESMKYAKLGYDYDTYSSAFEYVRRDYLDENLTWIFCVAIVLIVGLIVFGHFKKKKGWVFIKNDELKLLSRVCLHFNDVFNEIKQKKKGSVLIGTILIILYYVSATIKSTMSGFLFKSPSETGFNSLLVLAQTLGLVLLWTIANWAVCTLMQGKGKMREIFIVTSYALVPLIISNIVYTILSQFFITSESTFLSIISAIFYISAALILISGTMIIHDYGFGKFVGTTILSVLGILIIIFLLIAVFILVQQLWSFFGTLYREIFFRVN